MSLQKRVSNKLPGIVIFLTIGLGILGGELGIDTGMVWVVGFVVLLPIAGMLNGAHEGSDDDRETPTAADASDAAESTDTTDPLDRLRDRYARGELGDEAFERKLEALLETQTYDGARDRVARDRTEPAVGAEVEAE
ncbi:SHOCT domain-containing protein [Halobium salinum]|uniref:SHOCT domain-containing protein n=1 Tax=Halobium salinum TaxID=1364940 RepID=A0ABD5PFD5_9EURY|nr:SHOCT domain-containing protein [Halobium salinum]